MRGLSYSGRQLTAERKKEKKKKKKEKAEIAVVQL
jgi:hypothetical protein